MIWASVKAWLRARWVWIVGAVITVAAWIIAARESRARGAAEARARGAERQRDAAQRDAAVAREAAAGVTQAAADHIRVEVINGTVAGDTADQVLAEVLGEPAEPTDRSKPLVAPFGTDADRAARAQRLKGRS